MNAATVGLLSGAIGVAGTLLGVLFTQWRSDVWERSKLASEERREEQRLNLEAERERDARLFDHRREAYASVVQEFHRWTDWLARVEDGHDPDLPEDGEERLWRTVSEVELHSRDRGTNSAALLLYVAVTDLIRSPDTYAESKWHGYDYFGEFLTAARAELPITRQAQQAPRASAEDARPPSAAAEEPQRPLLPSQSRPREWCDWPTGQLCCGPGLGSGPYFRSTPIPLVHC